MQFTLNAVRLIGLLLFMVLPCANVRAQTESAAPAAQDSQKNGGQDSGLTKAALFVSGAAVGLLAHEAGHLAFDVMFDADPYVKRVEFHGIPFFALSHRNELSRRGEVIVASAGFWVQHATDEWILTKRPRLKDERAPFAKGVLAFNVLTSVAYAGAAFAKTGPFERDTRAIADGARIDEGWVGAIVLAPAVLDSWRYLQPESRLAVWLSRSAKIGMFLLLIK